MLSSLRRELLHASPQMSLLMKRSTVLFRNRAFSLISIDSYSFPALQQVRFYRTKEKTLPLSETNPELQMFLHPNKNSGIDTSKLTAKAFTKVWWKCPKGVDHEWLSAPRNMIDKDGKFKGCPFCKDQFVSVTNSLATRYPEIAAQWHPTKNGSMIPSTLLWKSSKKVWWQCDKDPTHIWKKEVRYRTNPRSPTDALCPFCTKMHPATRTLDVSFPEIAKEWDYEKNGNLLPSHVSRSSAVSVWWKCEKGHEWKTSINNRTSVHHSGCPYCSGRKITPELSLLYQFPEVAAQWHPTLNGDLKPSDVFPYTRQGVWWLCTTTASSYKLAGEVVETLTGGEAEAKIGEERGCGKPYYEKVINKVRRYKESNTLLCIDCYKQERLDKFAARRKQAKAAPKRSKSLKSLRITEGNAAGEVIFVSANDYDTLLATGNYAPVEKREMDEFVPDEMDEELEEEEEERKELYGKKELFKVRNQDVKSSGPRQRRIIPDLEEGNKSGESGEESWSF